MMLKRVLDVLLALVLLVLTAPIQALTAALVALDLGRPVFFHQARMGRAGQPFQVFKFRSMRHQPEGHAPLSDDARVTPLGRMIRRLRLDELPQALLILDGTMSVVGPRPLHPAAHAPENDALFRHRHQVRPGLTGWAQVNGNTLLSEREKLALDAVYIARVNPLFDFQILFLTLLTILRGERRNEANIQEALAYADRLDWHG